MFRVLNALLPRHKPFCLFGAAGVGKPSLIHQFAGSFSNHIHVDRNTLSDRVLFEQESDPREIIPALSFIKEKEIRGTGTLIILDEIARCPAAIRWFFNQPAPVRSKPTPTGGPLIIAISSVITDEMTTLMGKSTSSIQPLYLPPLTFEEFLIETDDLPALEAFRQIPVPNYAYERLLNYFHLFTLIGGMPEIAVRYLATRSFSGLKTIYENIGQRISDSIDLVLNGKKSRDLALDVMQNSYPFAASRISFSRFGNIDKGSREIKRSFHALEQSFLLRLVYPLTDSCLPVKPDLKKFPRLHMIDTGLVNFFSGIQRPLFKVTDMNSLFEGQIARQVAGQEITASGLYQSGSGSEKPPPDQKPAGLFSGYGFPPAPLYWTRAKAQSSAAVDFVIPFEGLLIPVMVRSGEPGRLRALHQFVDSAPHSFAVRLSSEKPGIRQCKTLRNKTYYLLNLPYFLAGKIPEHLSGFIKYVGT